MLALAMTASVGESVPTSGHPLFAGPAAALPVAAAAAGRITAERAAARVSSASPLTATVLIDGGAAETDDPTLHLSLTADGTSDGERMRFSLDGGGRWTESEFFAPSWDLPLPATQSWGGITVVAEVTDVAGDRALAEASIDYVAAPSSTMALHPRYLLQANLDFAGGRIAARETVDITNWSTVTVGHLDFSLLAHAFGKMSVASVAVDGRSVVGTYPNDADLLVPLGYNLRPGESAEVTINFDDVAAADVTDSLRDRLSKAGDLMQVSDWYPVLSDGHGLRYPGDSQFTVAADYRVELTHPAGLVIAAPGDLIESTPTFNVYVLPNARQYAFSASPDYVRLVTTTPDGVEVSVYSLPGTPAAAKALDVAARAIEVYSANLGAYPYSRFVVAQETMAKSGEEYSGLVFVGGAFLGNRDVVAHEAAHQWWYGIVGDDQLRDPWLDEAFTEFTGHYFFNPKIPAYCSPLPVNSPVYAFPDDPAPASRVTCGSYDQTVYYKGAWFLDGVRQQMGTANFMAALRALQSENRFRIVTTNEVRSTFVRFAPDPVSLDTYMNGFLAPSY